MNQVSELVLSGLLRASLGLSLAALAVALVIRVLRIRAPRTEQLAWFCVLLQGLVCTSWSIPVPAHWLGRAAPKEPAATISSSLVARPAATSVPPVEIQNTVPTPDRGAAISPAAVAPGTAAVSQPIPVNAQPVKLNLSWPAMGVMLWLLGIMACLGLGILRYRQFIRRLHSIIPVPPEWLSEWHGVLKQRQVSAVIPLLVTTDTGPALCRLPAGDRLIVPAGLWGELSPVQRLSILQHELAHWQRGDVWSTLAARVLATLHWFNPLAWWALARFEAQSEFACDQVAAEEDPTTFAEVLIQFGSPRQARLAGVQSVFSGSLFERVRRLLTESPASPRWKGVCLATITMLGLVAAIVRVQAIEPPAAPQAKSKAIGVVARDPVPQIPQKQAPELVRLGSDNLRTRGYVTDLAFVADGKVVIAASREMARPVFCLFDVDTGALRKKIVPEIYAPGFSGAIECLAVSRDQSKLVWGESRWYVGLWDLKEDRLIYRDRLHKGRVHEVAFSDDGQRFASFAADGIVRLRRVADPQRDERSIVTDKVDPNRGEEGVIRPSSLAFTPDGQRLVVGSSLSGDISIWQIQDGTRVRTISRAHGATGVDHPGLNFVAVTPDGQQILSAGSRMVLRDKKTFKYGLDGAPRSEICLWDIGTGLKQKDLTGSENHGFGHVGLSRDGQRLAVANFSQLRILNVATGDTIQTISLPGYSGGHPEFSPNGELVALSMGESIGLFETSTGRRLHHHEQIPAGLTESAAWSPAGDRLVTGHADGIVRVWDSTTGHLIWHKLLAPVVQPGGRRARVWFANFSGDGRHVVVAGGRDDPVTGQTGVVEVYEADTGLLVRSFPQPREVRLAALSSDGKVVVIGLTNSGLNDPRLIGIEVETGNILYSEPFGKNEQGYWKPQSMHFPRASSTLLLADLTGGVLQVDGKTGREQRRFLADWRTPDQRQTANGRQPDLWSGSFTADGRILVTSTWGTVYVWDMKTGALLRQFPHTHPEGCDVCVSSDGNVVATASRQNHEDDLIVLFDVQHGRPLMKIDPGDNHACKLTFSPDSTKLFTGFVRGSATVWDVRR